jgi:hypothetical protein
MNELFKTPGQIAYEGYLDFLGAEDAYGYRLAEWDERDGTYRAAWEAAAEAAIAAQATRQ